MGTGESRCGHCDRRILSMVQGMSLPFVLGCGDRETVDAVQACAHQVLALWGCAHSGSCASVMNQFVDGVRRLSGVSAMGIHAPMAWVSLLY